MFTFGYILFMRFKNKIIHNPRQWNTCVAVCVCIPVMATSKSIADSGSHFSLEIHDVQQERLWSFLTNLYPPAQVWWICKSCKFDFSLMPFYMGVKGEGWRSLLLVEASSWDWGTLLTLSKNSLYEDTDGQYHVVKCFAALFWKVWCYLIGNHFMILLWAAVGKNYQPKSISARARIYSGRHPSTALLPGKPVGRSLTQACL